MTNERRKKPRKEEVEMDKAISESNRESALLTLPIEILAEILTKLPIKDFVRLSSLTRTNLWEIVIPPDLSAIQSTNSDLFSPGFGFGFGRFLDRVEVKRNRDSFDIVIELRKEDSLALYNEFIAYARFFNLRSLKIHGCRLCDIYSSSQLSHSARFGESYPFRFFTTVHIDNMVLPSFLRLDTCETLVLSNPRVCASRIITIWEFRIESPSLRFLTIEGDDLHWVFAHFVLVAPGLLRLELDTMFCSQYSMTPMPMIEEVRLRLRSFDRRDPIYQFAIPQEGICLTTIFQATLQARTLQLSTQMLQYYFDLLSTKHFDFTGLKLLEIEVDFWSESELRFVESIVRAASEQIEQVIIRLGCDITDERMKVIGNRIRSLSKTDLIVTFMNKPPLHRDSSG